jgi:hypothetical protein
MPITLSSALGCNSHADLSQPPTRREKRLPRGQFPKAMGKIAQSASGAGKRKLRSRRSDKGDQAECPRELCLIALLTPSSQAVFGVNGPT